MQTTPSSLEHSPRLTSRLLVLLFCFPALLFSFTLVGCKKSPEYARPLAPGMPALRKLSPEQWPRLNPNLFAATGDLRNAAGKSGRWFDIPSTTQFFPIERINHTHARASVSAFTALLDAATDPAHAEQLLRAEFDMYESVGWNGKGVVLYTGYYTPIVRASRTRGETFRYPLYRRPPDLLSNPTTGEVLGRQTSQGVVPYPTRREIETSNMLAGQELVWLADPFERYLVQLQGSARLQMDDGTSLNIGYAGSNGREYTSVARLLVDDGMLDPNRLSMPAVRDHFRKHPEQLDRYAHRNDRYIFFMEYTSQEWPAGSLGFGVTPMCSLATDKQVFPRGGVVLVDTQVAAPGGGQQPFQQLMLDQDTGGAIRAPGRADIYMGIGPQAEHVAGYQYAEGRLYYLFLKPERVNHWLNRVAAR